MRYVLPVSVSFSVYIQEQPGTVGRRVQLQIWGAKRNVLATDYRMIFYECAIRALRGLSLNKRSKGGRCHWHAPKGVPHAAKKYSSDYVYGLALRAARG
jgi:hypothetical protein